MSNFDVFNRDKLHQLINPFLKGAVPYITPIKYQAITPDIFAFLFRTTGREGNYFFFVSLEFDYLEDVAAAERMIREWTGAEVDQFFTPAGKQGEGALDSLAVETEGPYKAVLAVVSKPEALGYWSDSVAIWPGDSIVEKLAGWPEKQIKFVQEFVQGLTKASELPTTNNTDYAISAYLHDGKVELFYDIARKADE